MIYLLNKVDATFRIVVIHKLNRTSHYNEKIISHRQLSRNYNELFNYRKSRTTFDTSETRRQFGPIAIDYAKVQSKVALKYDSLDKEILAKFGALLGQEMSAFHSQISKVTFKTVLSVKLFPTIL